MKKNNKKGSSTFEKMSAAVTRATGSTSAFVISFSVVLVWIVSGPFFNFSDTWQLVINTGTTIITFLMVFLIQRSQNKDSIAIHLKLNELIVAQELANNRLVSVEDINEVDLLVLKKFYEHVAKLAENDESVEDSHSLKEANISHERKKIINQKTKKS
ncbi:low affinity iron permease family protein [Flavobacterium sp.]|uniref:low affinity iron permease family protein n=1 Tax=Flavobacterium sp. TaxID=239 RepID=UPI00286A68C9|nr:low affinity iron permease family protein [Flavobacterium sp.]